MAKLERNAGRSVFAPLIFRLALKLEQVPWTEFSSSASEAIYVLRSAQRLFKLDAVCTWFDPWLEVEAIGMNVARDELGVARTRPDAVAAPPVETVLASPPMSLVVEIVRRTHLESGESGIALAAMSAGATLIDHVAGEEAGARILAAIDGGGLSGADADLVDYLRQLSLGEARAFLEAGAGALLLLQEVESPDLAEFDQFESVINLAAYYGTPVVLLARHPISARGRATLDRLGIELYATPDAVASGIALLPSTDEQKVERQASAWLALSRWEVDASVTPETIQSWRHAVIGQ